MKADKTLQERRKKRLRHFIKNSVTKGRSRSTPYIYCKRLNPLFRNVNDFATTTRGSRGKSQAGALSKRLEKTSLVALEKLTSLITHGRRIKLTLPPNGLLSRPEHDRPVKVCTKASMPAMMPAIALDLATTITITTGRMMVKPDLGANRI
jgi:hypothetical protein